MPAKLSFCRELEQKVGIDRRLYRERWFEWLKCLVNKDCWWHFLSKAYVFSSLCLPSVCSCVSVSICLSVLWLAVCLFLTAWWPEDKQTDRQPEDGRTGKQRWRDRDSVFVLCVSLYLSLPLCPSLYLSVSFSVSSFLFPLSAPTLSSMFV